MRIMISKKKSSPMYVQIKDQVIKKILSGELPAGFILPAERKLAEDLQVNRSTVVRAYQELKAEGFVDSKVGRGTKVLSQNNFGTTQKDVYIPTLRWDQQLKRPPMGYENNRIKEMMAHAGRQDLISFAGGLPGRGMVNLELMSQMSQKLHITVGTGLYVASPVGGLPVLKKSLCELMRKRSVNCTPSNLMITSGSQQGLSYIGRLLIEPGDVVLTGEPTYMGALKVFSSLGARVIGVPVETDGLDTTILETYIFKYRPKLVYVQPNFQNPTGCTMSLSKRKALLDLAYRYKIPIVEDDIYGDLRFEGESIPSLKALDQSNYVIYLSSFSKMISFGLRIGWICAEKEVIQGTEWMKQTTDLQTQTFGQYMMNCLLEEGFYEQEIKRITTLYQAKRQKMLDAIEKYPSLMQPVPSEGGFFIWVRLPATTSIKLLEREALSKGVAIIAGDVFYPNGVSSEATLRLSYSTPELEQIKMGIDQLAKAIKVSMDQRSQPMREDENQPIV